MEMSKVTNVFSIITPEEGNLLSGLSNTPITLIILLY